jgi:hypothetical protein
VGLASAVLSVARGTVPSIGASANSLTASLCAVATCRGSSPPSLLPVSAVAPCAVSWSCGKLPVSKPQSPQNRPKSCAPQLGQYFISVSSVFFIFLSVLIFPIFALSLRQPVSFTLLLFYCQKVYFLAVRSNNQKKQLNLLIIPKTAVDKQK